MNKYGQCKPFGKQNPIFKKIKKVFKKKEDWVCLGMSHGMKKDLKRRGLT